MSSFVVFFSEKILADLNVKKSSNGIRNVLNVQYIPVYIVLCFESIVLIAYLPCVKDVLRA